MRFFCLTLFPEMIYGALNHSMLKRASDNGIIEINCINIRDFSKSKHRQTDDYPYGGGAGMIMMAPPVYDAYQSIKDTLAANSKVLYMTPQGKPFNQKTAEILSREKDIVILCGHYEGVDERIVEEIVTDEVSLGDFVLTGGEIGAIAVIDAVSRLIPGVLSGEESYKNESFANNLLEYPQYTRPPEFLGRKVPEVLLSGHHENIRKWRLEKSIERTRKRRPDILNAGGNYDI
ncbi:MAG: tRNA (guanosine(37)-N1)-methyltransferase TrmD [Clostridiales bacterium]|jgi:tRNA (guanine37-N1)-methyltransferase|nr:tRNA (guanosine(37)-N1)-methyltransferase TrmD [Clostridiales bacterium]